MIKSQNATCLLAAFSLCFAVGCTDNNTDSEKVTSDSKKTSTEQSSSATADSAQTTGSDSSSTDTATSEISDYQPGENLAKTAALFDGSYTYTATVSYSDSDSTYSIVQVSDSTNFYQRNTEKNSDGISGDTAYLSIGSDCVEIDYNLGAYSACDENAELNIYESIISRQLDQTATHIPETSEGVNVEEYTYTGDTYMTVFDFYFDDDGTIEKYTATYTVEGSDDVVQTVEISSITDEVDESLFDESALEKLTAFDDLTEDERLGFCQGICSDYAISTDNMYELDITTDDLKRIAFDDFLTLVYTYGTSEK